MKLETYLNAYGQSVYRLGNEDIYDHNSREFRQVEAFRARILRMDAEKDAEIKHLKETCCHD